MALKFKVYKKLISREEKIERANDYNEFNGFKKNELGYINPEKFAEQDIYDEFIDFKCSSCGHEETLEGDIVFELFDEEFEEYPLLTCPNCGNETFIPSSILEDFDLKKS